MNNSINQFYNVYYYNDKNELIINSFYRGLTSFYNDFNINDFPDRKNIENKLEGIGKYCKFFYNDSKYIIMKEIFTTKSKRNGKFVLKEW